MIGKAKAREAAKAPHPRSSKDTILPLGSAVELTGNSLHGNTSDGSTTSYNLKDSSEG